MKSFYLYVARDFESENKMCYAEIFLNSIDSMNHHIIILLFFFFKLRDSESPLF